MRFGQYTSLTPSLFTKVPVPKVGGPVFCFMEKVSKSPHQVLFCLMHITYFIFYVSVWISILLIISYNIYLTLITDNVSA
jgi:hypothetical protein